MIGQIIGRYRIAGKLGEGGMGSVWRAEDPLLGRTIALKLLPEGAAAASDARRRFLREARAASALDHPGIAAVHDAGEHAGRLFIAVAFVDGETVRDRIAAGPLALADAVRVAAEAATALAHAHTHSVVHRDVTSSNIMLARDGRVVLIDFGLAAVKQASTVTGSGAALGTAGYMAPEVAMGKRADARSDLYGLGVVLYEMLTGVRPFEGERAEAVLYAAVNRPIEPPRRLRPEVPEALERIVLKALARKPEKRYADGATLAADLRTVSAALAGCVADAPGARAGVRPTAGTPVGAVAPVRERCVAVVPFDEASSGSGADADRALFARGLSEALSAALAGLPGLEVIPPAVVQARTGEDPRRRARELGATLMVCGTVQRSGDRLRVSFLVLSPMEEVQLAGDRVDGKVAELLAFEDRLADSVCRALGVDAAMSRRKTPVHNPAAREHYLQALGYLQRSESEASVDGAITLLERLAEDEHPALALAALGRAYLSKYRLTSKREWADRAADACERALALDPEAPEVMVTLGALRGATGHHTEAVRVLNRSLKRRPGQADALQELAMSYSALGRPEEAEQACLRAIALRPAWWSTWAWLGYLHYTRGHYPLAVEAWTRVVELTPDNSRGYYNLGGAYFQMGQYAEASQAYRRSLELQPNARAYSGLGTLQFMTGQYADAVSNFESATHLQPDEPFNWGNLADAHRWLPDHDAAARAAYEKAVELARGRLELDPTHARTWARVAEWLAKLGDVKEARRALARARKLMSDDVNLIAIAGEVHALLGEEEQAIACFERAVAGGLGVERLERDPELAHIRRHPAFQRLVTEGRSKRSSTNDTRSTQGVPHE
jgi:tetratricopeptide (TPR) repeat protein